MRKKLVLSSLAAFLLFSQLASAADPKASAKLNEAGIKLAEKGELDRALVKFRESVELDPKNSKAQFNLGEAAYDLKQWSAAQRAYESYLALETKPSEERDGLIRKMVLLRREHGEAPPAETMKLIEAAKKDLEAKKFSDAKRSLEAAQESAPWVLESTQNLAVAHAFKGEAVKAHEQVALFSKYAGSGSDAESLRSKVDGILSQKKVADESESEADKAHAESEGFMKHGGFSLSYLHGVYIIGNTASDDGVNKRTYKEIFSGSSGFDLNFFAADPVRSWMFRVGYQNEKMTANATPTIAVTPARASSNVNVRAVDVGIHSLYLGIGLKGDYFYTVLDLGVSTLSSSAELPPVNEGPIGYCALSIGAHVPLSHVISLSLEGRMGGPVGRAFYHKGPDTAEDSSPKAEWLSTNKILAGLIYRY